MTQVELDFQDVNDFWFHEAGPGRWWKKDDAFDDQVRRRFAPLLRAASRCELHHWRDDPRGRLAEIIVLDQFSRNMYRGTPQAFAQDALALALAQEAVRVGADQVLTPAQRSFLYMPYMHSESLPIHQLAEALYRGEGLEFNLDFELKHKAIIERFGRYPHRNAILGRESTPEETEFLKQPGSGF